MAKYIDLDKLKEFPVRAGHYDQEHGNEHFIFGIEAVLEYIEQLPPADVEPVVHAKWIARSDKGIISMTHPYMCSRCWRVEMDKEPYCNCGAKMDGGNNNTIN